MSNRIFKSAWLVLGILLASANSAWACPMCKLALETDDPQPRAYMYSILFMMGTIFTLFMSVGGFVWWISRREQAALRAAGYDHLFDNAVNCPLQATNGPMPISAH
ncbi:MAG: hypothetical protein U0872_05695 [Planctomycetaceae bacterium]